MTLITKIEAVDLQPDERQKVRSPNGAWYTTCDTKKVFYVSKKRVYLKVTTLALVDIDYPERHAYNMIYVTQYPDLNNCVGSYE